MHENGTHILYMSTYTFDVAHAHKHADNPFFSFSLCEHFHLLTSRFSSRISFLMRLHLNDRIVVYANERARARTHACKRSQTTIKRKAHLTQPRTASTGMRFKCICQQHTITFYGTLIPKIFHFFVIQFRFLSNNFNNF